MTDEKQHRLKELQAKYGALPIEKLLEALIKTEFAGKIASFSSFGSWSALLLDIVAKIDNTTPVLFLETGKHFPETLEFVETIKSKIGLKNIIALTPDEKILANADANGTLWQINVNRCCWIRKVEPLDRHLTEVGYDAVITGRRSYQTKEREGMATIELDDQNRFRINPFAFWSKDEIKAEFNKRGLPQHPLYDKGYPSIGCAPCTRMVKPGEDERAGRWAHVADLSTGSDKQKQECGIHLDRKDVAEFAI
jgi:phosphoadenosine phosphosulfate reductase